MPTVPLPPVPAVGPEGVTIGAAADLLGLTVETIRYYEREGLTLTPTGRTPDGWRRYTEPDLAWLAGVVMLRGTGMTMRELREFSAAYRSGSSEHERLALLEAHRTRVLAQLAETHRHLRALDHKIDAYRRALDLETPRHAERPH